MQPCGPYQTQQSGSSSSFVVFYQTEKKKKEKKKGSLSRILSISITLTHLIIPSCDALNLSSSTGNDFSLNGKIDISFITFNL